MELDPDFEPNEKPSLDHETARVGLHVSPSPRSDFITSVIYSDREETVETGNPLSDRRYFHPHGFFAEFDSTFVWQDKGGTKPAAEEFTSIDAAIGYRFPKRYGIVSLEARNLLDEEFLYQDLNSITSDQFGVQRPFIPDRTVILGLTLNF